MTSASPAAGENLSHFLKRLHPDLDDRQLKLEVERTLLYNRDYGNDLGDGNNLKANASVYLTSIKSFDDAGRPVRIESPTGCTTEIKYDRNGRVDSYQIGEANGNIAERAERSADGRWILSSRDGKNIMLSNVQIDSMGNVTDTDLNGNKYVHLTRGDELFTQYSNGHLAQTRVYRWEKDAHGKEEPFTTARYDYEYKDGNIDCYVIYPDGPSQRHRLDWKSYSDRLLAARGCADYVTGTDMRPDEYVETNLQRRDLVRRALSLAGVDPSERNINDVCLIVDHEDSSWDANATNNSDQNARDGHPSRGLMQTIDTTFAANAISGYDKDITDPLSNLIAGIRYAQRTYGSLEKVPGVERVHDHMSYVGY